MITKKYLWKWAASPALIAGSAIVAPSAHAVETEPYEYVTLPADTLIAVLYGYYGEHPDYRASTEAPKQDSRFRTMTGVLKIAYYFDLANHRALVSVVQVGGSLDRARIGNTRLGQDRGLGDTLIGSVFWPISDDKHGTYLALAHYLTLPTGQYDKAKGINLGGNRFVSNPGVALHQKIDKNWSFDLGADAFFYGKNDQANALDQRLTQTASTQWQGFINYAWKNGLTTSIGYQGFRGGAQKLDGVRTGARTDFDEIRFAVAKSVSPKLQLLGEINHQTRAVGGFRQDVGLSGRIVYVF